MLLSIIRYLKGYVKIRIHGYSPERFLNLCSYHDIFIWGLTPVEHAYEMCISLKDFRKLKPLLRKTQTRLSILEKRGLPFFFYQNRKRKIYFAGIFLCVCLMYLYSGFIWDIHFVGNETRTSEALLKFLETQQVEPGMKRRDVDCEQIVREIRKAYDDIVWVSASIDGSRLTIHVKENDDLIQVDEETPPEESVKDLVAQKDATITEIVTRQGVPLVHAGDAVKAGDILVTGRVEVLDDAGEVVDYQYHTADADIYGMTTEEYRDEMELTFQEKEYDTKKSKTIYFLQIGKYRIATGKANSAAKDCETSLWQRQLRLGESMYLPVYFGQISQKEYTWTKKTHGQEEIQRQLSAKFNLFCAELAKKGVQITENNVKILIGENLATAKGELFLIEPLGEPVDTEILTIERNETDESFGNND